MRFTTRELMWLTALVAMGVGWWMDSRRYDWSIKSAQLRKDYYTLMSNLARSEAEKAKEKQRQLSEALKRAEDKSAAAADESAKD